MLTKLRKLRDELFNILVFAGICFLFIHLIFPNVWSGAVDPLLHPEKEEQSLDEYLNRFPPNLDPNLAPMPFPE